MAALQMISLSDKKCSNLLQGLVVSPWQPNIFQKEEEPAESLLEKQMKDSLENLTISSKMSCSLCSWSFQSRLQQTDHYKLDWHRFNLKQSIMGKPPVSEDVFEAMTGEISSISGSDEDDDTVTTPLSSFKESPQTSSPNRDKTSAGNIRLPKVFFKNHQGQLLAIYRCLLQAKKEGLLTQSELIARATHLPSNLNLAILMTAGGHFAAAIFTGSEMVLHKTFHRYTVRAKRGTAQGARDGQQGGNTPRSAGATLRRYNEAQLQEDVGKLLRSWQEELDKCSCIFIRAPSYNRSVIFSGKKALLKTDDKRIRTIPFPTRRPTLKEVQRVWDVLSKVDCFDDAEAAERKFFHLPVSRRREADVEEEGSITNGECKVEETPSIREEIDASGAVKSETGEEDGAERGQSEESDDGSIEFVLEEVVSYTSHLRESEIFIPKQKRKRTKKKATPKAENTLQDKQLRKLQSALFTFCKTGDCDSFDRKMMQLREKITQDIEKETVKSNNQSEANSNACVDAIEDHADGVSCIGHKTLDSKDRTDVNPALSVASYTMHSNDQMERTDFQCDQDMLHRNGQSERTEFQCDQDTIHSNGQKERTESQCDQNMIHNNSQSDCDQQLADVESLQKDKMEEINRRMELFLNEKLESSGNLLLHVAAIEGQNTVLWKLLSSGANPAAKNGKGLPPFAVSKSKFTRQEFRRFMGEFPERYDYKTAQIPAPLSADEDAARATKAAEKRREQKKAKKIKQKELKEEQLRNVEEEREKQIFAALSDREKRAVAAEKRLAEQLNRTNRCFTCATSLEGKVPFHYSEFTFCSMECLKTHKQQHQL